MPEATSNSVYKNPLHLTTGDQSLLQIIPNVFDGQNFLHWSRNMRIALISKNKLGFVNGGCPEPADTASTHGDWIRTDYTVMRWIQFSLSEKIARTFNYVTSSKQLWEELNERYNQSNAPHLYKLRKEMTQISQGTDSVAEYYAKLKSVWEDLRSIDPLHDCSCNAVAACTCQLLKRIVERDNKNNLIDFLMGLDHKYDQIRGHILALEPLPSVNQAFAKVHQAEMQKQITEVDVKVDLDGVAMAATQSYPAKSYTVPSPSNSGPNNSQNFGG
ncbi:uncharacterized protein LOC141587480 [Silene latifolia]|uniref:uncharacterized protein LOC141587480 n=1 Tax=Silene latifolia TaxID=37657 RepID=UPI003D7715B0